MIKGIIGLPPNLFYGTGIPACIVVLDKENAQHRRGIFMIDASRGFRKDGNKNRLRSQDMHRIVDVFRRGTEQPRYSRMVGFAEIEKNEFNLNIPRYIDSSDPEDIQDLGAHLNGGIPERDIDALSPYWKEFPTLRRALFAEGERPGYGKARVAAQEVRSTVLDHPEFAAFGKRIVNIFDGWREAHDARLRGLKAGSSDPKALIGEISEDLLARFKDEELVSHYDVYQHLMDYWADQMQDDVYAIAQDGWEIGRVLRPARDKETPDLVVKKGSKSLKYVAELIPPRLVVDRFFEQEQAEVDRLAAEMEAAALAKTEFEEEHGGEDGGLSDVESGKSGIPKGNVQNRVMELKEIALNRIPMYTPEYEQARGIKRASFGTAPWEKGVQDDGDIFAELDLLHDYLRLIDEEAQTKKAHKEAAEDLNRAVLDKYPEQTAEEIKALVVDDKWMAAIERDVQAEVERVAQIVAGRVKALEERYAEPLPDLAAEVERLGERVEEHLRKMSVVWATRV